jgi:uncharacterized membrane protein YphA (DoxX/SURF4 family)
MLMLFPISFLAPLGATILRIAVGSILIRQGIRHMRVMSNVFSSPFRFRLFLFCGFLECISGALIILGLYTQIGALIGMLIAGIFFFRARALRLIVTQSRTLLVLIFASCFSLFITGAGIFAFDLPL